MADRTKMTDEELIDEVLEEDSLGPSVVTIKLTKPFQWMDQEYTELHFDFDKPTGKDLKTIYRKLSRAGMTVFRGFNNDLYITEYAALSCEEPVGTDMFDALPGRDYLRVRTAVSNFLLLSETL